MSIQINQPEIEDFWDDCIKFELPKKNKKDNKSMLTIVESNSCINFNNLNINNIDHGHRNKNKYLKKHKLLYKILTTEESIPKNKTKNKEKQIELLTSLYNKDISDRKRIEQELTRFRENKEKEELQNCTFKPEYKYRKYRDNKKYDKTFKKNFGKKKIYERDCLYKKKFNLKLEQLKKEAMEEKQEYENYPFMPTIREKNINKVLYGNNYWEKKANNFSNQVFLWRYMKARKDESNKKKRLIWSMDKNNNDDYYDIENDKNKINNDKNIHRSISQKDSLLYKQSLHFSLLDFKTNNENENNNNENAIIN